MRWTAKARDLASRFVRPNRLVAAAGLLVVATVVVRFSTATPEAQTSVQTITCNTGFGTVAEAAALFVPLTSLKSVPNPVFPPINPATNDFDEGPLGIPQDLTRPDLLRIDDNLTPYVTNVQAAIQLGKALFWDMQAGSDNQTACGTCHFHAGADGRHMNQLSPGANLNFADSLNVGPNHALQGYDFPFTDQGGDRSDNTVGSQGVRKMNYGGLGSNGTETTTVVADPVFHVNGTNIRQVGGVQAPPVINAVFNHRNFWDGRAQPDFNGVDNWGTRNGAARVWTRDYRGDPIQTTIRILDAGLASQAVGPPLNPLEMTAEGRTFPELGKKMLGRKPLGLQKVAADDGVLGGLAEPTAGLSTTYTALIQAAFSPAWWDSRRSVSIGGKSYTMMQANFSMFWGLSIMMYQATLVSDDTPMDRYLASRVFDLTTGQLVSHNPDLLAPVVARLNAEGFSITVDDIVKGLELFELPLSPETAKGNGIPNGSGAACSGCHVGAELTSASVRNLTGHAPEPGDDALRNVGFDLRMERMFMNIPPVREGTDQVMFDPYTYDVRETRVDGVFVEPNRVPVATYDTGWYNVGVRATAENIGLGRTDAVGGVLSWTRFFKASANPGMIKVPGGGLGCATTPPAAPITSVFAGEVLNPLTGLPLLAGPLLRFEADAIEGSFKTPSLRNVELTGPYFHNGGKATLGQVLEFYDIGADFGRVTNPTRAPLIMALHFTEEQEKSLLAFLVALTDERVRWQKAPFDRPAIVLPNGATAGGADRLETLAAVGQGGATTPLGRFLNLPIVGEPPPPPPAPTPVAAPDSVSAQAGVGVSINVLGNDSMSDSSGVPAGATIQIVAAPTKGTATVNANNWLDYIPSSSATGADSLQYQLIVNGQTSGTATVSITIAPGPTETIAILDAKYRTKLRQWQISGTSTGLSNQVLQVKYLPPGATDGPVIGTPTVSAAGSWALTAAGSQPASGSTVKVTSQAGTVQTRAVTITK